jgi:hypothetical protein
MRASGVLHLAGVGSVYFVAPRWRGTSPVARLRSARQIRGLGALPACAGITLPPGFVGPVECDPTLGGPSYPASQSQVLSLQEQINALVPAPGASWVDWVNQHAGALALAGGSLVALMVVRKVAR